jgi:hypothetical protein
MSEHPKSIRKQIRNVCQELVNDTLFQELEARVMKAVLERMNVRMDIIANNAKDTLERIDKRASDVQSLLLRNSK